ncbi:ankyrin repeat domain-containing protein [Marinilabilia sp.]
MTKTILALILGLTIALWSCNSSSNQKEQQQKEKTEPTQSSPAEPGVPIHQAAFEGNIEALQKSLNSNTKADLLNPDGHTPLMLAAFNGHTNAVKLLIEKGASTDIVDQKGLTPLHFAASGPYPVTVEALLENGSNINAIDSLEHFTPLMYAAAEGNTEVVKVLIRHGADKSLTDIDGDNAAAFARQNGHTAIAELLE